MTTTNLSTKIRDSKNYRSIFNPSVIEQNVTKQTNILTKSVNVVKSNTRQQLGYDKFGTTDISSIEILNKNDIKVQHMIKITSDLQNRLDKVLMNLNYIPDEYVLDVIPYILDFNNIINFCKFEVGDYLKIPNLNDLINNIQVQQVFSDEDNLVNGINNDFVTIGDLHPNKTKSTILSYVNNLNNSNNIAVPKLSVFRKSVSYNSETSTITF